MLKEGMRKKILVVEDESDMAELMSYQLKKAGFAVGTASDGIEALKKARTVKPDLILLDLMLPELDGFAVCEILRRNAATASVPIMMVTALSTELARLAGLEAGADAYVTKPFEFKALLEKIHALLEGQHPLKGPASSLEGAGVHLPEPSRTFHNLPGPTEQLPHSVTRVPKRR
jgi:DNA-binding response OmpR family regulator